MVIRVLVFNIRRRVESDLNLNLVLTLLENDGLGGVGDTRPNLQNLRVHSGLLEELPVLDPDLG